MGKAYLYKGKKYSNDRWLNKKNYNLFDGDLSDLIDLLVDDRTNKLEAHTITYYEIDGEMLANENTLDSEEFVEELLSDGYLEDTDIIELPTEDDMPDIIDGDIEDDPERVFGVE